MNEVKQLLRRVLRQARDFNPIRSPLARLSSTARSLSDSGRWDEALQIYKKGFAISPRDVHLWRALLNAPEEAGYLNTIRSQLVALAPENSESSERGFVRALQKIDKSHQLAARYVGLEFRGKTVHELEAFLEKLNQSDLIDLSFLKSLSDYFWENGRAEHALLPSELYVARHRHLHLLYRVSEILSLTGSSDDRRVSYLNEAVACKVESPVDALVVALAFTRLRKWNEAVRAFKDSLDRWPRDINLWQALLNAPRESGCLDAMKSLLAERAHEASDASEQGFVRALREIDKSHQLAARYVGLEFREKTVQQLEAFLVELNQSNLIDLSFLKSLSDYFWENGLAEHALPPSEWYLKRGRHLHILYRVSEILALRGSSDERRVNYLNEAVFYDAKSPVDALVVALAFTRLRKWDEAIKAFEGSLDRWPSDLDLWRGYGDSAAASEIVFVQFARSLASRGDRAAGIVAELTPLSAVYFLKNAHAVAPGIDPNGITDFIVSALAKSDLAVAVKRAEDYITKSAYTNAAEFQERFFLGIVGRWSMETGEKYRKAIFRLRLQRLFSRSLVFEHVINDEEFVRAFCRDCNEMRLEAMELDEPIADLGGCTPWVPIYTRAVPHLYADAALAIHDLCAAVWPRLKWTAPHIDSKIRSNEKIKVGFTCLDFMPMISGLMERLNPEKFERIFLQPQYPHPGGETARNWVARADRTVKLPVDSIFDIQEVIAREELDIIVAGPSVPSGIYPMMARLARIQMTIIEPNWCDNFENVDYYITWSRAEPADYRNFHKNAVALMEHPPYWLEMPSQGKRAGDGPVTALRDAPPHSRVYVCPTSPVKLHPAYDEVLKSLLSKDEEGIVVFLRMDSPWAHSVRHRMVDALGPLAERLVFLPSLTPVEAHALLNSVDCVLDAYPLGGMSSSFVAAALGTPTVSLPAEIPFGKWMGAIYDYIGVAGLTAKTPGEYAEIAYRLATDTAWREAKALEIREKQSMLVESHLSATEFEAFLLAAAERHSKGLSATDWVHDGWVDSAPPHSNQRNTL
ncbi:putative O-linked N-acetylglucosamine transferase (SPINDLY family)/ribosomal protein L29 [Rhizobium sp. BK181]|uniref:tetratricopeptide repeat protein n=1 Tax=Rhizobium sp. BK181 TaxID=2587072 RepID=UPI001607B600|nr:hypothetical protein [Rhizobium sp. BK181]MBB3315485.1 putative O-linked N-acetylglucosamine transferase (SPINDLY family)/ribosomal protein L29 [Rhizobium sp. BK181]